MQYNPSNVPYSTGGYPPQMGQEGPRGTPPPSPSNAQRFLHRGQVSINKTRSGFNIPVSEQASSPWGQRNVSPCFNQANLFQDNFVPDALTTNALPSPSSYDKIKATNVLQPTALSQANSMRHIEPISSSSLIGPGDNSPLIALSPVNNLQLNKDSNKQHTPYSMDLEGLDFTANPSNLVNDQKLLNSSVDELSSDKQKTMYPDYSHVFNEIRGKSIVNNIPQLNPYYPQAQNRALGLNYGWNMSYLSGNQQSQQPVSGMNNQSNYQSTFRSNWTYQSPRPTYNVWALDQRFIMPTSIPTSKGSLTQVASSSDFDSLRKPKKTEVLAEDSEVYQGDYDLEEIKQPRSRTSSDLMHFEGLEEKEYMSLDSFDPLYSRTRRESILLRRNSLSEEEEKTEGSASSLDFSNSKRPQSGLYPLIQRKTNESVGVPDTLSTRSDSMSNTDALEQFLRSSCVEKETKPDVPEPPPPPKRMASGGNEVPYERLHKRVFFDEESETFSQMVSKLKSKFKSTDIDVNRGYVISAFCEKQQPPLSIKIIIHSDYTEDPVVFTCDVKFRNGQTYPVQTYPSGPLIGTPSPFPANDMCFNPSDITGTSITNVPVQNFNQCSDFARFLLKKDLVFARLSKFDDHPENYLAWKASFKSLMGELGINSSEELDLLVKYLGPQSHEHAVSIRDP